MKKQGVLEWDKDETEAAQGRPSKQRSREFKVSHPTGHGSPAVIPRELHILPGWHGVATLPPHVEFVPEAELVCWPEQ